MAKISYGATISVIPMTRSHTRSVMMEFGGMAAALTRAEGFTLLRQLVGVMLEIDHDATVRALAEAIE